MPARRAVAGRADIRMFVDPQNPVRVGILMDVADMDTVTAAMETPAAAETVDEAVMLVLAL